MDDYDSQDYDGDNDSFYTYDADNDSDGGGFYNPVRDEENFSIRPDFLNRAENGAVGNQASKNRDRNNLAKKDLKSSENVAAKNGSNGEKKKDGNGSAVSGARALEKGAAAANPTARIINSVKGKKNEKQKGGIKKKAATIAAILTLFGGGIGIASIGQAFQPFAYVSNVMQNFDVGSFSSAARLRTTMKAVLKGTKASAKLKTSLANTGIETEVDDSGKTKFKYEGSDGKVKTITNDAELDSALKSDKSLSSKTAKAAGEINNDSFFGKVKSYAMERINALRNRWDGYGEEGSDTSTKKFEDIASGEANRKKTAVQTAQESESKDDKGKVTKKFEEGDTDPDSSGKKMMNNIMEVEEESGGEITFTSEKIDLGKISKAAKIISGIDCTYIAVTQAIAAITIGQQIMDMINAGSGYAEATQKCQIGEGGDCAAMKEYSDRTNSGDFWQAVSIRSVFGGGTAGQSAGTANLENIFNNKSITTTLVNSGLSIDKWKQCIYAKMISAGIDFLGDVVDVITAIATGGGSAVLMIIKNFVKGSAKSLVVGFAVGQGIKQMIKLGAEAMNIDVILDMGKKVMGDYSTGGMKRMLTAGAQATGASMGTPTKVAEFNEFKNSVIADRAQYDRDHLSPFDVTSKYTFLGSIVHSMSKFSVLTSATTTPLVKSMSSVGSLVADSVQSVLPRAMAAEYNDIADAPGDCWLVNSIDATGDANLCYEYIISDTNTFSISYDEAKDFLCKKGYLTNCGEDQTPTITEDTGLASYIEYWTMRDTHPGLMDSSISANSHLVNTGSATLDGVISNIPIIGAVLDFADAGFEKEAQPDIFASRYVAGGEYWNEDMENFQTFLEYDNLYEQLGLTEHSVLAAYLDDYYEKNPLDYSYEGTLARFSGMPKATVVETLAYMDYLKFTEEYNPGTRYAFGAKESIEKNFVIDENGESFEYSSIAAVSYFDLRNKTFAV